MPNNDQVEIDVEVLRETEHALLVFDGKTEAWVPKSQIFDSCSDDKDGKEVVTSIFIPEWLATKKGLV